MMAVMVVAIPMMVMSVMPILRAAWIERAVGMRPLICAMRMIRMSGVFVFRRMKRGHQ